MSKTSFKNILHKALTRRKAAKRAGLKMTSEELDQKQLTTFLNISRDFGSMGTGLNGHGEPIPTFKK